jgi:hypothetical protein
MPYATRVYMYITFTLLSEKFLHDKELRLLVVDDIGLLCIVSNISAHAKLTLCNEQQNCGDKRPITMPTHMSSGIRT